MKKTIIILFISLLSFSIAHSKDNIFESLKNKINSAKEIYTQFEIVNQKGMEGTLIANSIGEYKIIIKGRIVTSDGKTIWNYAPQEKKVMITNVEDMNYINVSTLFKMFTNDYKLIKIKKSLDTELGKTYKILLEPIMDVNLPNLSLWLTRDNSQVIKMISYDEGNGQVKIKFSKMKYKQKKSNYKFKIPKDTEVIDLR